jgi:hypothetical protein
VFGGDSPAHKAVNDQLTEIGNSRRSTLQTLAGINRNDINARKAVVNEGVDELTALIEGLGELIVQNFGPQFGAGAAVKKGENIFEFDTNTGYIVDQIGAFTQSAGTKNRPSDVHFGLQAKNAAGTKFFSYDDYDKSKGGWSKPIGTKQGFAPWGPRGGSWVGVRIDKSHLRTGTVATVTPPGYDPVFNRKGHLVAAVLAGPGNDPANIVALTTAANYAMEHNIELKVRDDVDLVDAEYEYRAKANYTLPRPQPSDIDLHVERTHPVHVNPPQLPNVNVNVPNV